MIELTEQEQQAVDAEREPRLIDPRTNEAYVLVRANLFDRFKALLTEDDGPNMRQVGVLVERAMHDDDANDPTLGFYQQQYGPKS